MTKQPERPPAPPKRPRWRQTVDKRLNREAEKSLEELRKELAREP